MRFSRLKIGTAFRFTARGNRNNFSWRKVTQRGALPVGAEGTPLTVHGNSGVKVLARRIKR